MKTKPTKSASRPQRKKAKKKKGQKKKKKRRKQNTCGCSGKVLPMSLPTASSVSSPGGNGAETSLLYFPVSAYSVERGQGHASTAARTLAASDLGSLSFPAAALLLLLSGLPRDGAEQRVVLEDGHPHPRAELLLVVLEEGGADLFRLFQKNPFFFNPSELRASTLDKKKRERKRLQKTKKLT